jgi:hypothetical protein
MPEEPMSPLSIPDIGCVEAGGVTIAEAAYFGFTTHMTITKAIIVGIRTTAVTNLKCFKSLFKIRRQISTKPIDSCFSISYLLVV